MLQFCTNSVVKESHNSELAHLKMIWFDTFAMLFFTPLDMLLVMKTLKDELYIVIKAYKFTEIFLYCHMLCMPTYRVYRLYDT